MRPLTPLLLRAAVTARRQLRTSEAWFILLALLIGVMAGLAAVALGALAHAMQALLFGLPPFERLSAQAAIAPWRLLALPLGGALLGGMIWIARRRTPIDVVEANTLHGGRIPGRDTFMVAGQTVVSNGTGASVGLEAAYAQVGGGLASLVGQRLKLRRNDLRTLVGAGAGAALGAAFGAPLAGAFYAFEIVLGAYTPATIAPVAAAALAAALTARSLGAPPYLIAASSSQTVGTADYLLYAGLGLVCAGVGIAIMRLIADIEGMVRRLPVPDYARPLLGGLCLMPIAFLSPQALSAGHGALDLNLTGDIALGVLATVFLLKVAASSVSLGFGFRGGLFFASLFLGALLGRIYAGALAMVPDLHPLIPSDAALVGMAALAVAIVGGPMTMALLVLEVTHDFALTGTVITASLVTSAIVRERFGYSFSTWRMHLRGETVRSGRDIGWVRSLTAGAMMRRDVPTVRADTGIARFRDLYPLGAATRVVLVEPDGAYAGIVRTADAYAGAADAAAPVASLATLRDATLSPEMNIATIMAVFDSHEADDLAVVGPGGKALGILTEKYARRRYSEELEKAQRALYGED